MLREDTSHGTSSAFGTTERPHATAPTTPPASTYVDVPHTLGTGMLLYVPETNGLVALWPEEWLEIRKEADYHDQLIQTLQEANRAVTDAAIKLREAQKAGTKGEIQAAEQDLEQKLSDQRKASKATRTAIKPLTSLDVGDPLKMVELLPLTQMTKAKKFTPIYIKSDKLKKALSEKRVYLIDGQKEKTAPKKLFNNGRLDTSEVKRRILDQVQDKAAFKAKWKAAPEGEEEYAGVLGEWAKTMKGDLKTFIEREKADVEKKFNLDPNHPQRNIDLEADAQLMRWSAGAGLEINFKPFAGNLSDKRDKTMPDRLARGLKSGEAGIKANAHAAFAVAEGKVRTLLYYPHVAGWHIAPGVLGGRFDLGYFRFEGDLMLYGTAGASIAVEVDIGVTYAAGKQGIKGTPRGQGGMKASTGASGELDVFAGAKAGIDADGALQWLNPEGLVKQGPAKVDPSKAIPEYTDIAAIKAGVAGIAGAALKGAFKIEHRDGKFIITAKLGACLGLGGEGSLTFEVGAETIGDFFKCVAYQLKDADYAKMVDEIDDVAYRAFTQILYLHRFAGANLLKYVKMEERVISTMFDQKMSELRRLGVSALHRFKSQIDGWFRYMPPEAKGLILAHIAEISTSPDFRKQASYQQDAAWIVAEVMATFQTPREKHEVLQHMAFNIGDKVDVAQSTANLNSVVAGTAYANCLQETDTRLASASPIRGRPFLRNDEPNFVVAQLGLDHPLYA
jgi:hypothetical protein